MPLETRAPQNTADAKHIKPLEPPNRTKESMRYLPTLFRYNPERHQKIWPPPNPQPSLRNINAARKNATPNDMADTQPKSPIYETNARKQDHPKIDPMEHTPKKQTSDVESENTLTPPQTHTRKSP